MFLKQQKEYMLDITIPMNKFSVDNITTEVTVRKFNGNDINLGTKKNPVSLSFKNPLDNRVTYESSNVIKNFGFNGTALLTPAALFDLDININNLEQKHLTNNLLFIDISKELEITDTFLKELIIKSNIDTSKKYIILFYTGFMDKLKEDYSEGTPNDNFWVEQENRPYLSIEAVNYLNKINIATTYIIDNVSFEENGSATNFFPVTSALVGLEDNNNFKGLVYHVIINKKDYDFMNDNKNLTVNIELGNVPTGIIKGYSVSVKIY